MGFKFEIIVYFHDKLDFILLAIYSFLQKSSVLLEDLEQAGSIPSLYPPSLSPVMQLIDAEGRALIKQLQNSSEIYAKIIGELTGTRGHWNTANKSNQNDLKNRGKDEDGSSSDEHDDEYGEGEGDDYGSSGIDSDTSNSDDEDIQEEDEGGKMKRKRGGTAKGMQERNSVISQRSKSFITFKSIHHVVLNYTLPHYNMLSRNVMLTLLCTAMCMRVCVCLCLMWCVKYQHCDMTFTYQVKSRYDHLL